MFNKIVINKKISNEILNIKNLVSIKIIMKILKEGYIDENILCEFLEKKLLIIQKNCIDLMNKNILRKWKNEKGEIIYTLDNKYFDIDETCKKCKFHKYEKINDIGNYMCIKKGKECIHNYSRLYNGLIKIIKKKYKRVDFYFENFDYRNFKSNYNVKHIDKWNMKDFYIFYIEIRKEYWPELLFSEKKYFFMKNVSKCCDQIKKVFKKNYKRFLKQYIRYIANLKKENGKYFDSEDLIVEKNILNFVKEKSKNNIPHMCDIKNIYCSYCLNGKCTLINIDCTETIILKMKEKYN
jgi:hypothetical protein